MGGYCIRRLLLTNLVWKLEKKAELDPVGNRVWVVRKLKGGKEHLPMWERDKY